MHMQSWDLCVQILALDVAIDGVEMRNSKPHSTQIETVRCSAVHDAFKSKMRNVQAFLIIPGPRGPAFFAPFRHLILRWFAQWGPSAGACAQIFSTRTGWLPELYSCS